MKNANLAEKFTPKIRLIITMVVYSDTHSLIPFISEYATQLGADVFLAGSIITAYSLTEDIFEIISGYARALSKTQGSVKEVLHRDSFT